ncbi:hypothetical protein T484DRAFT_1814005, partial [Baffinella frigidus]
VSDLKNKVSELKNKVDEDSMAYSSAKNRNSTDMAELKRQIDEDQKQCLHYSEEKVSSAQCCLDMIQQRLNQLDDDIAGIDEFMLMQPIQRLDQLDDDITGIDEFMLLQPIRLDDDIAGIHELMLSQPIQGENEEGEEGAASRGGGAAQASRKRKANTIDDWLQEGKFVEVEWDKEWWQASIKKIKYKQASSMSKVFHG